MSEEQDQSEHTHEDSDFELPEDFVKSVTPCDFLKKIYGDSIVFFDTFGNRIPEFIKIARYSEMPDYMDIPILESYKMFIESFNAVKKDQINSPPQEIQDYLNYLTSMVPQRACFQIANTWPPSMPRIVSQIEPLTAILIKIISELRHPNNFIKLVLNGFFPKNWTSRNSGYNEELLAISACTYKKKTGCWAYLERETRTFYVVGLDKNGKETTLTSGKVKRFARSKDKKSVIAKNELGRFAEFTPDDPVMTDLWPHIFEKEISDDDIFKYEKVGDLYLREIPFVYYLTRCNNFFPAVLYRALYSSLKSNDMVLCRAALSSDPPYSVVDGLLTLYMHFRKPHLFLGTAIGMILEDDNVNPMQVYTDMSYFRKFNRAIFERFGSSYLKDFLIKLLRMIDRSPCVTEQLFFSVVKYITYSGAYIPFPIRHAASIIRSYSTTKFNSRGFTYIMLGGFFGHDFICPVLMNTKKYFPEVSVNNPESVKLVAKLLQFIFRGALLPDQFSSWNHRVESRTLPEMDDFLYSLGDLPAETPSYPLPGQEEATIALHRVMSHLLSQDTAIRDTFDDAIAPFATYTPQVSWNFATCLSDFFRFHYDRGFQRDQSARIKHVAQRPIAMSKVRLPMYGIVAARKSEMGGSNPMFSGSFSDEGSPHAARERSIPRFGPPPKQMYLPGRPKDANHNPMMKDDDDESDSSFTLEGKRPVVQQPIRLPGRAGGKRSFSSPSDKVSLPPSRPKKISLPQSPGYYDTTDDDNGTTDSTDDIELRRGTRGVARQPLIDDENISIKERSHKKVKVYNRRVIKGGDDDGNVQKVREEVVMPDGGNAGKRTVMRTVKKLPPVPK